MWYHKVNSDNDPESEHLHVTALKDGVATACIFNTFHRHCQNLSMAHLAQTVNALPLIYARETPDAGMFVNPQYLAFKLYVHHTGELSVRSRVDVETYHTAATSYFGEVCRADVPYLDVSATYTPGGRGLYLHVVNRHATKAIACEFDLRGAEPVRGVAHVLAGDDPDLCNTYEHPERIKLKETPLNNVGSKFTHSFPPVSATILELR